MAAIPKHRELERSLLRDIEAGLWQAGERIPSEHELSRQFGVSYMTARQAVGNLVTERRLQRVPGKGTFVLPPEAGESVSHLNGVLALLVPALWHRLDPYYFPDVLGGFESGMEELGRNATIYDYATADREDLLSADTTVACLLIGQDETQLVERLRDRGCCVLAVNRYTGRRNIPSVMPDNAGGTALAVDHLASLGHTHIGFIRGVPGNLDAADRCRGFRQAMKRHGFVSDGEAGEGFQEEFGYRAARQLLCRPKRPTALVCSSDLAAIGAIKAAQELGIAVPGDLSVVGFGDFSIASYVHPGLTTIYLPRYELGQSAARSLVALSMQDHVGDKVLPTSLVLRGTTAPPP